MYEKDEPTLIPSTLQDSALCIQGHQRLDVVAHYPGKWQIEPR